jgi:hypothetical protein
MQAMHYAALATGTMYDTIFILRHSWLCCCCFEEPALYTNFCKLFKFALLVQPVLRVVFSSDDSYPSLAPLGRACTCDGSGDLYQHD